MKPGDEKDMSIEKIGTSSATKVSALLLGDLYRSAKGNIKQWLKRKEAEKELEKYFDGCDALRFVKTVWQVDRDIDLNEFYVPTKLYEGSELIEVVGLEDIKYKGPVIIQGIAGQGKSIFLRYLCFQIAQQADRLPIHLELRKLSLSTSLLEAILASLELHGISGFDESILEYFSVREKIVLLLDGFDEIPIKQREGVLHDLQRLHQRLKGARIIISSRPDSGVERGLNLRVYKIAPYREDQYYDVIRTITKDEELSQQLTHDIKGSMVAINGLLSTPLLMTMMIILYRARGALGATLPELYDELFYVMLSRHDVSKPLYRRERRTKFTDRKFRSLFATFCYLSKSKETDGLSLSSALDCCERSLDVNRADENSEHFFEDIVDISCLLIRDGVTYYFLHETIQEYYAAVAVQYFKDDLFKAWAHRIIESKKWNRWDQVLQFLSIIDSERYRLFFHRRLYIDIKEMLERQSCERLMGNLFAGVDAVFLLDVMDQIQLIDLLVTNADHAIWFVMKEELFGIVKRLLTFGVLSSQIRNNAKRILKVSDKHAYSDTRTIGLLKLIPIISTLDDFYKVLRTELFEIVDSRLGKMNAKADHNFESLLDEV